MSNPSTLTPTGARHQRGFRVQLPDGRIGRTYHSDCYIRSHINVHIEISPGVYSDESIKYTREKLKIVGYIN